MEESLKYFVPETEDISIGYECERNEGIRPGLGEGYSKYIFQRFEDITDTYKYGVNPIRTPYLTKEQIEAEGWKQDGESPNGFFYYFTKIEESEFYKKGWRLSYYKNDKWLAPIGLQKWHDRNGKYDGYEGWGDEFSFDCKSINEFRKICKLIGI